MSQSVDDFGTTLDARPEPSLKRKRSPLDPVGTSPRAAPASRARHAQPTEPWKEHLDFAQGQLLPYIRSKVYNHEVGYKSDNKRDTTKSPDHEARRIAAAKAEIDTLRSFDYGPEEVASAALHYKGHRCSELAHLAVKISHDNGVPARAVGAGHVYAVLGEYHGEELPRDFSQWPRHLVICDPWTNIVCRAQDFAGEFHAKMQKWAREGKEISLYENQWISPVDPWWKSMVVEGRKFPVD